MADAPKPAKKIPIHVHVSNLRKKFQEYLTLDMYVSEKREPFKNYNVSIKNFRFSIKQKGFAYAHSHFLVGIKNVYDSFAVFKLKIFNNVVCMSHNTNRNQTAGMFFDRDDF